MPPMGDASERLFQDAVEQLARMNGWLVFHASPHQVRPGVWRSSGKGFPDLVLAHPQRGCIFAELKTQQGKLSEHQLHWADALIKAGVEHYVWRPSQLGLIAERLGKQSV